jgi:hypothetical protein
VVSRVSNSGDKPSSTPRPERDSDDSLLLITGVCTDCTSGEMQYCHSVKFFGVLGVNGAFAEYCIVDSRMAAKIPDGMSFERVSRVWIQVWVV